MMLNLWLMLTMDYKANFDRCHDKLNAEHVTMTVDGDTAGGLVGKQNFRRIDQGPDDAHALGLAAGDLRREFLLGLLRDIYCRSTLKIERAKEGISL